MLIHIRRSHEAQDIVRAGVPLAEKMITVCTAGEKFQPCMANTIAKKMVEVKKKGRLIYEKLSEISILNNLGSYSINDLKEML